MEAFHIIVTGIVQGVGFRYYTKLEADKYQLCGTVQNLMSGDVEIYVEGKKSELLRFLDWCHVGPKTAQVDRLESVSYTHLTLPTTPYV